MRPGYVVAALVAALPAASRAQDFGPPHPNAAIVNSTLSVSAVQDGDACAQACLAQPSCIAYTLAPLASPGAFNCTLSRLSNTYAVTNATGSSYFSRIVPRNDAPVVPALAFVLSTPAAGVRVGAGSLFGQALAHNRKYLSQYPLNDMLFWFRARAGVPQPPNASSFGWDDPGGWEGGYGLHGSVAGAFMMGAAGQVRWANDSALWATLTAVVDGIGSLQEADGFAMAFPRNATHCRENPDYASSATNTLNPSRPCPTHRNSNPLNPSRPCPTHLKGDKLDDAWLTRGRSRRGHGFGRDSQTSFRLVRLCN